MCMYCFLSVPKKFLKKNCLQLHSKQICTKGLNLNKDLWFMNLIRLFMESVSHLALKLLSLIPKRMALFT